MFPGTVLHPPGWERRPPAFVLEIILKRSGGKFSSPHFHWEFPRGASPLVPSRRAVEKHGRGPILRRGWKQSMERRKSCGLPSIDAEALLSITRPMRQLPQLLLRYEIPTMEEFSARVRRVQEILELSLFLLLKRKNNDFVCSISKKYPEKINLNHHWEFL